MHDLHNNIRTKVALLPAAIGANATKTGVIIDRQGYGGVEFVVMYGAVTTTGTVVTAVMKEGDATGSLTSVADGDMLGTEALVSLLAGARVAGAGKEVTKRIGYVGTKRYAQLNFVQTGTTSVGYIAAAALLHSPESAPQDNP